MQTNFYPIFTIDYREAFTQLRNAAVPLSLVRIVCIDRRNNGEKSYRDELIALLCISVVYVLLSQEK